MLEPIQNLPEGLFGLRAKGEVSKEDYEKCVVPALEDARREGRRVRFLYHFGPEFGGFSAGGAWEDLKVGLRYLRLFERCAVVTDLGWLRSGTKAAAVLMPCPVRVFDEHRRDEAVACCSRRARRRCAFASTVACS